jgi:hypothetical protein
LLLRKASRAKRLSVFLSTALFAERRDIVKPKRAVPLGPAHPSTVKNRSDERTPVTSTRPNSVELRSRWARVKLAAEICALRVGSASGRETGSTFRAPALDNFLSTARRHASSETVRAFAAQVAGLVSSFHGSRHPATEKDQQKQIDGDQSERGTLRAAGRCVNTKDAHETQTRTRPLLAKIGLTKQASRKMRYVRLRDTCLWITGQRSY